jgi:hypothetical protein
MSEIPLIKIKVSGEISSDISRLHTNLGPGVYSVVEKPTGVVISRGTIKPKDDMNTIRLMMTGMIVGYIRGRVIGNFNAANAVYESFKGESMYDTINEVIEANNSRGVHIEIKLNGKVIGKVIPEK